MKDRLERRFSTMMAIEVTCYNILNNHQNAYSSFQMNHQQKLFETVPIVFSVKKVCCEFSYNILVTGTERNEKLKSPFMYVQRCLSEIV
ncbi:hypothetical protein C0J52_16141 [Blattella germanica]|nr:hypothetical protein C0J52_16141 [Blattella germanica]